MSPNIPKCTGIYFTDTVQKNLKPQLHEIMAIQGDLLFVRMSSRILGYAYIYFTKIVHENLELQKKHNLLIIQEQI